MIDALTGTKLKVYLDRQSYQKALELLTNEFKIDFDNLNERQISKLLRHRIRETVFGMPETFSGILMANHQVYLDWIYLFALMSNPGHLHIILKKSLSLIPIIGQGNALSVQIREFML